MGLEWTYWACLKDFHTNLMCLNYIPGYSFLKNKKFQTMLRIHFVYYILYIQGSTGFYLNLPTKNKKKLLAVGRLCQQ